MFKSPLFLIILINSLAFSKADPIGFELSGSITYTGTRSNSYSKRFYVKLNNCHWSIVTSNAFGTTNGGYHIGSFDGTNIFRVDYFGDRTTTSAFKLKRGQLHEEELTVPSEPKNKAAITIKSNDLPSYDGSLIAPLWLAFASGCVLDRLGSTGSISPVWITGSVSDGTLASAEWIRSRHEPRLPIKVIYQNAGKIRVHDNLAKREIEIGLPSPYQNGYTSASLEAEDFKVEADLEYPSFVRIRQFGRKTNAVDSEDLKVITETEITVDKFSSTWKTKTHPQFDAR